MIKKEKVTNSIIKSIGKEYECPICCENLNINDYMICTECKHIFHYKCIKQAIEKNILNCPICRSFCNNIYPGGHRSSSTCRECFASDHRS